MHRHCEPHEGRWAAGRHHRRGRHGGFGFGGRHGGGMNPDDMRAGRMLAQGDLRLIALALIAQEPRHGYEIIKLVEEKTSDWYSPSPGIVYPTLTYLEEAGYVTASTEGAKKLYAITPEGRVYLEANRDVVDAVLDRLTALGERINRWRRSERGERCRIGDGSDLGGIMGGDLVFDLRHPARLQFAGHQPIGRVGGIVLAEGAIGCIARRFEITPERLTHLVTLLPRLLLGSNGCRNSARANDSEKGALNGVIHPQPAKSDATRLAIVHPAAGATVARDVMLRS